MRLTSSTAISKHTAPPSQAARRWLPSAEATGIATMHPAKTAQTRVCRTLMARSATAGSGLLMTGQRAIDSQPGEEGGHEREEQEGQQIGGTGDGIPAGDVLA